MNIFVVSSNVKVCARALDDKRLNKMILECAQLVCTDLHRRDLGQPIPYKPSHVTHPITKWVAESDDHLNFVYALGLAYGDEILYRFGRKHACYTVLQGLSLNFGHILTSEYDLDEDDFFNGARHRKLGLDFTHLSTYKAYRAYLNERWPGDKRKPVWTARNEPRWKS